MELKTFVFYLLLCQYLVQRMTSKIAESEEEWSAKGCCQNCPNLTDIVRDSGNQRYVKSANMVNLVQILTLLHCLTKKIKFLSSASTL